MFWEVERKVENLIAIYEPTTPKMCDPQHLTLLQASTACYRNSVTFIFYIIAIIFILLCSFLIFMLNLSDIAKGMSHCLLTVVVVDL
jgi:hypothetical protein